MLKKKEIAELQEIKADLTMEIMNYEWAIKEEDLTEAVKFQNSAYREHRMGFNAILSLIVGSGNITFRQNLSEVLQEMQAGSELFENYITSKFTGADMEELNLPWMARKCYLRADEGIDEILHTDAREFQKKAL